MKYIIITKRTLFTICIFSLVLTIISACFSDYAVPTQANAQRKIPIYCVSTEEKKVAITFDAAWGADDTDTLIEILSKYDAKATIFVVGEWAEKYPESVKKFKDNGHEIGNHSHNHTLYSKLDKDKICEDIKKCNDAIYKAIGEYPALLRAPSGDYTEDSEMAAIEMSMKTIQWSVDSLDWRDLSSQEIKNRVLSAADNGSIILFHNDVKNTPQALDEILNELKTKGFEFVTVSELIYSEPYRIDATGKQIKQ